MITTVNTRLSAVTEQYKKSFVSSEMGMIVEEYQARPLAIKESCVREVMFEMNLRS